MTKLEGYFDAIVISDEVDSNHAGAVRVKIFGVTDDLKQEHQPFAIPITSSLMAVPTKGTLLRVEFDNGDVNQPKYFSFSPEKTYLPRSYVDSYPNVAVANLGDDLFIMYHDRKNKATLITHPSDSALMWTAFGTIVHDSENGYNNAGRGANSQAGKKIHPVLTEATIDVFCCTAVGSGDANQGSEYMQITHVSKSTVDMINGQSNATANTDDSEFESTGTDESIVNSLLDGNGNKTMDVTFIKSPSFIEISSSRTPTHILIGASGNDEFVKTSKMFLDKNSKMSAHYLIGRTGEDPSNDATPIEGDKSTGFAQFVDIKNDTFLGSNSPSPKNPALFPSVKANKNAITIMLIGKDVSNKTSYQQSTIIAIKENIKYTYKTKDEDLMVKDINALGIVL